MSVEILPHNPDWLRKFEAEYSVVANGFGSLLIAVHHVGSTSIPGAYAKPIVDMIAEVCDIEALDERNKVMAGVGYEAKGEYGIPGRRYFRKSGPDGVRAFHLHVFQHGSRHSERMLAFRDYLRAHPDVAARYSEPHVPVPVFPV